MDVTMLLAMTRGNRVEYHLHDRADVGGFRSANPLPRPASYTARRGRPRSRPSETLHGALEQEAYYGYTAWAVLKKRPGLS